MQHSAVPRSSDPSPRAKQSNCLLFSVLDTAHRELSVTDAFTRKAVDVITQVETNRWRHDRPLTAAEAPALERCTLEQSQRRALAGKPARSAASRSFTALAMQHITGSSGSLPTTCVLATYAPRMRNHRGSVEPAGLQGMSMTLCAESASPIPSTASDADLLATSESFADAWAAAACCVLGATPWSSSPAKMASRPPELTSSHATLHHVRSSCSSSLVSPHAGPQKKPNKTVTPQSEIHVHLRNCTQRRSRSVPFIWSCQRPPTDMAQ